jgi:phosphatidylserine/phosphatidylglycerophosphate/cardiolipin synthase-like enzyme
VFVRLLVTIGLVASAAALSPLQASAEQSASRTPSPTTSPSSSDTASPSATGSPTAASPSAAPARRSTAAPRARTLSKVPVTDPALVTTITRQPYNPSTTGRAVFGFEANRPGMAFRCTLRRPGRPPLTERCKGDTEGGKTVGTKTYIGNAASRTPYTFTVQAFSGAGAAQVNGTEDLMRWRVFNAYAPASYSPRAGTSFNRPLGSKAQKRGNLAKMIRTISSMPGYKQAYPGLCPTDPAMYPGTIRVSLYSLTDQNFAKALEAAGRRCLSVQVLMNNHLDRNTDPAWRRLEDAFGTRVFSAGQERRSFAHRCSSGCRGSGVLHTKMYLFDSTMKDARRNRITKTTVTGSSNMTSNAARIQYNDLYTVRGREDLYGTFLRVFNLMKRDDGVHRTLIRETDGPYQTTFWPQRRADADPELAALRSVTCKGANGGTGLNGRSVVFINMHAWFGTRGMAFANQVRRMYNAGCYVRILYGFMSYGVFKKLHKGTNSRMSVRRTLFSKDGKTGYLYTHLKNIDVSGYVGDDRSAKVAWTGSNNFTNDGTHFDEVMMRIESGTAYNSYVRQFKYISKRKSSATYANFTEPTGGGRAPKTPTRAISGGDTLLAPPGTPTVTSPEVYVDADGEPHALD